MHDDECSGGDSRMSGPLLGLPAAVADVQDKLGRVQTAGGWAGAVFDGCVLEDGKVKLFDYQEISVYGVAISGGDSGADKASNAFDKNPSTFWLSSQQGSGVSGIAYIGQEFVSEKFITKIRLKTESSTRQSVSSAKFQVWSGTNWVDVQTLSIVATDDWQEFTISNPQKSAKARLLANENLPTDGNWLIFEMEFYHTDMATVTGTASLDISPSSLYAWRNLYFKTVKPANTDIICAVKDTSDNVLIPNISDGGDLSSIDPTQYETLRLVWTLTRDSVEDESPVVYEPFWSWLGVDKKSIANKEVEQYFSFVYLTTTRTTLISVNNKGGRACAFISGFSSGSAFTGTLYLTIDGVEYTFSKNGGGLVLVKSDLSGTIDQASISAGFEGIALILAIQMAQPIYFKNSFKAEAKCSSNGGNAMVCVEVDA